MAKAGFIQEIMDDAIDSAVDTEDTEDAAAEAVDQVLQEITGETLSQLASVPATKVQAPQPVQTEVEEDDALMRQLAGLKAS